MNLKQRIVATERLFKRRSFVIESPGIRSERLKDGRVQLHARTGAQAAAAGAPKQLAELTCFGGRGGTLVVAAAGVVEVQILEKNPSAILTEEIWILEPVAQFIGTNVATGTVQTFGPFAAGVELVFGIKTNDTVTGYRPGEWTYKMGAASRNPDGLAHDQVDCGTGNIAEVGFEDLYGNLTSSPWVDLGNPNAGDNSYNDARIKVSLHA